MAVTCFSIITNDGRSGGGTWPGDSDFNRNQAYISLGEFRDDAWQPVWFSRPKLLCESGCVPIGPAQNGENMKAGPFRVEVATYTSLTECDGERVLWYPDRKHFLLGRFITDNWLQELKVSRGPSLYAPFLEQVND